MKSMSQKNNVLKPSVPEGSEVLITGAGGALAHQVVSRLRHDYNLVLVDFRHKPQLGNDITSYKVDFNKREFEDIFRKHQIRAVLHLGRIGAQQGTRESRYNANVIGTQRMLDFCVKYGVQQVSILSTYHVYGANPYNPALIEENAPLKAAELTMDLIDSVELENLANIYLWRYPELHMTILRPCNIVGPGISNTISKLLLSRYAPWVVGFSPMMQFIHVEDMADAIVASFIKNHPGIYNVAPDDWVSYTKTLELCDCRKFPIPSLPPAAPRLFSRTMKWKSFPAYLVNYFKFAVIIDGSLFAKTFDFEPAYSLEEIFTYYSEMKRY